jgi:hypothetical protein
MAISPDMIFEKAFRWLPRRPTFFLSAVWTGSQLAAFSLLIPEFVAAGFRLDPDWVKLMIFSPVLLGSGWLCPNIAVLTAALMRFGKIENLSIRSWGIFAGIESLFCVSPPLSWLHSATMVAIVLGVWLMFVTMLAAGVWFFHQWQMNHWAGEIAMLRAENASRLARREEQQGSLPVPDED